MSIKEAKIKIVPRRTSNGHILSPLLLLGARGKHSACARSSTLRLRLCFINYVSRAAHTHKHHDRTRPILRHHTY
jgi:hypothetical protein